MNIGQIIAAKGIEIRGENVLKGAKVRDIAAILHTKVRKQVRLLSSPKPLQPVVQTTSLFAEEMERLKIIKKQHPTLTEDELLSICRPFAALRTRGNFEPIMAGQVIGKGK